MRNISGDSHEGFLDVKEVHSYNNIPKYKLQGVEPAYGAGYAKI